MTERVVIQDHYPAHLAVCYGCGRNNPEGIGIRTAWDGREGVFRYTPAPHHTAYPGFVYGGLIASLIDCHAIGVAAAATYAAEGREPGSFPAVLYVTANLSVDYLRPVPIEAEMELRAWMVERTGRKAVVECTVAAGGQVCAKGRVVGVRASFSD